MSEEIECFWIPQLTSRGRVSTMFHTTDCGQNGAAYSGNDKWKYCPYCSRELHVVDGFAMSLASDA